jgi:hypothetical protein
MGYNAMGGAENEGRMWKSNLEQSKSTSETMEVARSTNGLTVSATQGQTANR